MQSAFLTPALVQQAFENILPRIEEAIRNNPGRKALCLHVLEPYITPAHFNEPRTLWTGTAGEKNPAQWDGKTFAENARKKATTAWRVRMSMHLMRHECPALFQAGDFKWDGGVFCHGIPGGASGLSVEQDIQFITMLLNECNMLIRFELEDEMKKTGAHILE